MAAAPGPDGHHDDLEGDELAGLALLVPDDPRSLDGDRLDYLRELQERREGAPRRGRRRTDAPGQDGPHRAGSVPAPSRLRRIAFGGAGGIGLAGPLLLVALVVVGMVGSTFSVFGASGQPSQRLSPLASAPAAAPGQVGGLLPNIAVTVGGRSEQLRDARPAVLVLVPTTCAACGDILASVRAQAQEYGLSFALVGPATQSAELDGLAQASLGGAVPVAVDDTGAVQAAYQPVGVTAVLVRADGTVAKVVKNLSPTTRLETALTQLDPRSSALA